MTLTLKRCLDSYVVEHARPERCDLKRIGYAQARLIEFFGADRDVEGLKRADVRAYRSKRLSQGVTDSTIRRELVVLRAALEHAAEEERIQVVPVVKLPPEGAPRERWLTEDEAVKIMAQDMSDRARLFLYLAFGTGARKDAIETVPVKGVDLKEDTIDFRDPTRKIHKKKRVKTKIVDWLRPHIAKACVGKAPTDYLLGGDEKNPLPSVGKEIKRVMRAAGIDEKGVGAHAIRKTFINWSLENGAKLIEVSAATGDSVATLEKSYIRVRASHAAGAVNSINNPERKVT